MAVFTYEDVIPTLIPNTTMKKRFIDGVFKVYVIAPANGYVLNDRRNNHYEEYDENDLGVGEPIIRFYSVGECTVRYDYDFTSITAGTITDVDGNEVSVNKVGAYEIFAIPQSLVPADQIYGGGDNDHEVM